MIGAAREPAAPVLYGRDAETATVDALLGGAPGSPSAVLVVRGEAGVGKSALLRHAVGQAGDVRVLQAYGVESESELAFAGLHQLVWPLLDGCDELPPQQAEVLRGAIGLGDPVAGDRFHVSSALLGILAAAAETRPLLCIVDDVHWLDRPSADALAFVARRLSAEPIVFLFASCEGEQGRFDASGLAELWLERLDREAGSRWLEDRFGDGLSPFVREQLLTAARGNPLALLELPKALSADQLAGRERLADPLPVTAAVESAFLRRICKATRSTQQLLLVAASDDTASAAVVRDAAHRLGVEWDALDEAESTGLLRTFEGTIEFQHPLMRSVAYQTASLGARHAAHRALADVLDDHGYGDRRAWHRAAATLGFDADVAGELEREADLARVRIGYGTAATALERAAALTPGRHERGRRLAAAAEAAWLSGRSARAAALIGEARRLAAEPRLRAEIEHLGGLLALHEGAADDAVSVLLGAAAEAAAVDPDRAASILLDAAEAAELAGDRRGQLEVARRAAALRPRAESRSFELDVIVAIAAVLAGDVEAGTSRLRELLAAPAEALDLRGLSLAGVAALHTGDFTAARGYFSRYVAGLRSAGASGLLPSGLYRLALADVAEGRFAVAAGSSTEGLRLAEEMGQLGPVCHHQSLLAWIAAAAGREQECRDRAREAFRLGAERGLGLDTEIAAAALGELELALGRQEEALAHFTALRGVGSRPGSYFVTQLVAPSLVEAALRADGRALAEEVVADLAAWVDCTAAIAQRALLERCRALLDDAGAGDHFAAAVRLHTEAGRTYDCARTRLLQGEALRRTRQRREARVHLYAALDLFEKVGADAWASRARAELRGSGMTAQRGDASLLDQLTPQELQVARLVAAGATNKDVAAQLFLSPRTIDFHLRNVFAKLGITSRMQLNWFQLGDEQTLRDVDAATGGFAGATARKAA
jgi:DNA-binding NarL/FixJ family response regulator